jgi:glucokinase
MKDVSRGVSYVLAADVGATNTRLRVSAVSSDSPPRTLAEKVSPSGDAAWLKSEMVAFSEQAVEQAGGGRLMTAAIGLPGKVSADRQSCAISYLDPDQYVSFADLFERIGVLAGLVLNDLECGALGAAHVDAGQLRPVCGVHNEGGPSRDHFVIGMPGSGFGVGLYRTPVGSMPSEGGNLVAMVDPTNAVEAAVWDTVAKRHLADPGRSRYPTYEWLLRAMALEDIFRTLVASHLTGSTGRKLSERLDLVREPERPVAIAGWAASTGDDAAAHTLAREAFQLYGTFLGRAMQSVVLVAMPDAVYLGGAILISNHMLMIEPFTTSFQSHVQHSAFLKGLPVSLITSADVNLDGATSEAVRLLALQSSFPVRGHW